ncbi:MAG: RNA polymerase-associated protein RapA [Methanobacteriota archaeon]|nr:MAG: RNA polymerase-associated protein RapA [Euryarchaeota archaeon]
MTLQNPSTEQRTWAAIESDLKIQQPASDQNMTLHFGRWEDQPHQHLPVARMFAGPWKGILVADEVGLGKTISAMISIRELHARGETGGILIACPGSLRSKWKNELAHRVDLDAKTPATCASFLEELDALQNGSNNVVIVSHGVLRRAETLDSMVGQRMNLLMTIVDEAHHVRNPKSRLHDAIQMLFLSSRWKMLLTATPVNLDNEDLFVLLSLIAPDRWPDIHSFRATMSPTATIHSAIDAVCTKPIQADQLRNEIARLNNYVAMQDDPRLRDVRVLAAEGEYLSSKSHRELVDLLREMLPLNDMLVRTRRKDLDMELAQRAPVILHVNLTEEEWALYRAARAWSYRLQRLRDPDGGFDWASIMPERMASSCLQAYASHVLQKIEEALENPPDEEEKDVRIIDAWRGLPEHRELVRSAKSLGLRDTKYEALIGWLRKQETDDGFDGGVLLFSQFHGTLEHLLKKLNDDGLKAELLTGKTPLTRRDEIRERFANGEMDVLLSSEVGTEGLDQQHCHRLVNYDLPWNPMKLEQRIGRLDRYGQRSPVIHIANMCVQGTIDAAILGRLLFRIQIFETSLGMVDPMLGRAVRVLAQNEISRNAVREDMEPGFQFMDLDHYLEIENDEDVEEILQERNRWITESALKEREVIGADPGVRRVRSAMEAHRVDVEPEDVRRQVERWVITNGGDHYESADGIWMIRLSNECLEELGSSKHGTTVWKELIGRFSQRAGPQWLEITYSQVIARERTDLEFVNPWHPLMRISLDESVREFGEDVIASEILSVGSADSLPTGTACVVAIEWRVHGLNEHRIRRWLALDNEFNPLMTLDHNPWIDTVEEPQVMRRDSSLIQHLEEARTRLHGELLFHERNRLAPLLNELTINTNAAWKSRIEAEEVQIQKAEWNATLRDEVLDIRWLRMKRGIINRLHEQLNERIEEIDRIRQSMQASIAIPIVVLIKE